MINGGGKKKANKIKKGIIKTLNESEMIKIYENSMNSSHSFKAGLRKLQHTAHLLMRIAMFMLSFTPPSCPEAPSARPVHTCEGKTESLARVAQDQLEGFWLRRAGAASSAAWRGRAGQQLLAWSLPGRGGCIAGHCHEIWLFIAPRSMVFGEM